MIDAVAGKRKQTGLRTKAFCCDEKFPGAAAVSALLLKTVWPPPSCKPASKSLDFQSTEQIHFRAERTCVHALSTANIPFQLL